MEQQKKSIEFVTMSGLSTSSTPQYNEIIGRDGIVKWGDDNLYPDYYLSLMNRSAKHNAILRRKASMIGGNGFLIGGLDAIAINFLHNPYSQDTLNDILYKISYDLITFGGYALQIIWSKDKSKIAQVEFIPMNKIRVSECRTKVFYSDDWGNTRKYKPAEYPAFKERIKETSILIVGEYRPGNNFYPIPDYISSVNWIELEYEISLFHLSQVKNGFSPGMIINFTSVPSEDEMDDVIRQLKADFEGAHNAGKVMFLFSDGADRAAQVTPMTLNDSDTRFIELNKEITQGILTGHGVTNPNLFSVSTPNEMGAKSIIIESLEIFQSTYIMEKQTLIENTFNRLLRINGSNSKLEIKEYQLNIEKIEDAHE